MPERLFIDTSAFIALAFTRDIEAGAYDELITSSYVLDELMSWFSRYPEKKVEIGKNLRSGVIRLEWVDRKVEDAAWRLFLEKADHPFSLTDCTSFILMDRLGVKDVFTFDSDFRRLGKYKLRPG